MKRKISTHKLSATIAIFALLLYVGAVNATGTFSGKGDDVTETFELHEGVVIFGFDHDGSHNFIVKLYNAGTGKREDLLANVIGKYTGKTIIAVTDSGKRQLNVKADGNWKVTFEQPKDVSGKSLPQNFHGKGDGVIGPVELKKGSVKFEGLHAGEHNFIVKLYESNGRDKKLVFNEIGPYEGKQLVEVKTNGNYYIRVVGNDWTIKITQEVKLEPTPEPTIEIIQAPILSPTPEETPSPIVTPSPTPEETQSSTPQVEKDSDGDGVPDKYDYAPNDPTVQTKEDVKTPGFGAIFAICSLLTVAYLVLRRR